MPGYINNLINDVHFVPLATHAPDVFVTHDGTPIIVSSNLAARFTGTAYGKTRTWLKSPIRFLRGKR